MEIEPTQGGRVPETLVRIFVSASVLTLAATVALVFVHFYYPGPSTLALVSVLTAVLAGYAMTSVAAAVWFAWERYRQHRRAMLFVVGITLATL
ncbi:MAG: hypothetical protein JRM95_06430, partial [Nitrososphaerota archaeon]|nr:hypothetical protein [Nitrososphaerota archaeon]